MHHFVAMASAAANLIKLGAMMALRETLADRRPESADGGKEIASEIGTVVGDQTIESKKILSGWLKGSKRGNKPELKKIFKSGRRV